jgi:hypothetical protein
MSHVTRQKTHAQYMPHQMESEVRGIGAAIGRSSNKESASKIGCTTAFITYIIF